MSARYNSRDDPRSTTLSATPQNGVADQEAMRQRQSISPATVLDFGIDDDDTTATDDVIQLPNLNMENLLNTISTRFNRGEIHTWAGKILLIMNPFENLSLCSPVSSYSIFSLS